MKNKFNEGDLVVLKDIDILYENRNVERNNETFKRHYDYIKSKEPLTISYFYDPNELTYDPEDYPDLSKRGLPVDSYVYNIQTPRSKLYLFYP